jgi:hypothetical protein
MKQETNNEIDLLLRRLSRRQNGTTDGDHLDADELSSYAENALPAAARARYTEHLAECSRCRELVVQLSSAAGVVVAETSKASEPSGLRKFLASLFSPMVLRYAIPTLGLIVVAMIGFAVFRTEELSNAPTDVAYQREAPIASEQKPQSPGGFINTPESNASPAPRSEVRESKTKETQPPPPNAAPAVNVTAEVKTDAPAKEPQQTAANEAPAQPAPKPAATPEEAQKKLEFEEKKQDLATVAEARRQNDLQRARDENRPAGQVAATDSAGAKRSPSPSSRSFGIVEGLSTASRQRRDAGEKDSEDGETRSVAGRRFRKKGGIWVDTAYDGGATTDLTRRSEQYRALVADEPGIKTIADQLDGQIIVVWKGRTYKIR